MDCSVIRDLLPLYFENMVSAETRKIIEEHLKECASCREEFLKLKNEELKKAAVTVKSSAAPLKKIKADLLHKKRLTVLFTALITLALCAVLFGFLTTPVYLSFSDGIKEVKESGGMVTVSLKDKATQCGVERYFSDGGYVYYISAYSTVFGKLFNMPAAKDVVLNGGNEEVISVYYCENNKTADKFLFGRNLAPDGEIYTLPRLCLTYYLIIAAALFLIFIILALIFKKSVYIKILFAPASYIFAHFLIKGFNAETFSPVHDLFTILLCAVPLYFALLVLYKLIIKKRE